MGAALCKIQDPSKPAQLSYLANQNNEFGMCLTNNSKDKTQGYCVFNEKEAKEVDQALEKGNYTGGHVKCFASYNSAKKVSIADNISLADAQAAKNASMYRLATPNLENIRKGAVEKGQNPDDAVKNLDASVMMLPMAVNMACNGQDQAKCDKAKEEANKTYNEIFTFNPLGKAQAPTATPTPTPTPVAPSSVATPSPLPVFVQRKSFVEENKYLLIVVAVCVLALIGLMVYSIVASSTPPPPPVEPSRGFFFGGLKKLRFNPKLKLK